jgi:Transcriptional regulator, AbiEi antitoxin
LSDLPGTLTRMAERWSAEFHELAARQSGVVAARQLTQAGVTKSAINSKIRTGRWRRMHRGVYATFSGEPTRLAQLWAAVLCAGPGAMLSHQSAAELARLADRPTELIHVTVPITRRVDKTPGIVVHYSTRAREALHPARLPPQTRIEETVLDLASAAQTLDDACGWVTRSLQRGLTTQAGLGHYLELRPKIRWRSELAELLTLDAAGLHSALELRYRRDVERPHGLPRGTRQARFRRGDHNEYRDVLYEAYLTAVELDGELAHTGERWRDARRDNAAAADGIFTLRHSWFDVTKSPCQVAAEVARVLARRGFAGARPCSPTCPVGTDRPAPGTVRRLGTQSVRARTGYQLAERGQIARAAELIAVPLASGPRGSRA